MALRANLHTMNYQRSFTLLETIVAMYVLLAGIVGAMNLAQENIKAITLFRHQLVASNLAQEGAELVRNRRDSNYLDCYRNSTNPTCYDPYDPSSNPNVQNMVGITDGSAGCSGPKGCRADDPLGDSLTGRVSFTECDEVYDPNVPTSCRLLRLNANGVYQYSSGPSTIFDRRIRLVQRTDRGAGLFDWEVISTVSWCEKLDCKRKVEVREILTPHLPR